MLAIFKKTCIVCSVALLVLTACSSGGGGGGQPTDPSNPSTKEPTSDSKKEPTSDSKKEPTSDSKKEPTSDSKKEPTSDTPPAPPVVTYKLPDTGQTRSYTNTRGEDSDYNINPPSYTVDAAKKTVLDNNTGLMWEQLPDAVNHERKTYAEAITRCGAQTTGDYKDWRLPKIDELESIVNFGRHNPAIDPSTFPNTKFSSYWSSTIYAPSTSNARIVNFGIGFVDIKDRNNISYIRCVRLSSTEPATRFTNNRNETITDNKTKLMWQQLPDAADHNTTYTWENALTRCEGLTFAGHSDWRLPNTKELSSIADLSRSNPAIDPSTFPNTRSSNYWSSTVYVPSSSDAWLLDFNTGNSSSSNRSATRGHVRCVR